jgi:hypothetical protein
MRIANGPSLLVWVVLLQGSGLSLIYGLEHSDYRPHLPEVFCLCNSRDFVDRLFHRDKSDPRKSHELTQTKVEGNESFRQV